MEKLKRFLWRVVTLTKDKRFEIIITANGFSIQDNESPKLIHRMNIIQASNLLNEFWDRINELKKLSLCGSCHYCFRDDHYYALCNNKQSVHYGEINFLEITDCSHFLHEYDFDYKGECINFTK